VSLIHHVVVWAHRRRWIVFSLSLLLVVVCGIGLTRLRLDADVINLLPRQGRAISPFRTYLQQFGSLDQLFVVFTAAEGHSIGDYSGDIDRWIAALRGAPEIEWVDAGVAGADRDWAWLGNHQLLLLRGDALQNALSRLQPGGMARALESSRQLLAVPSDSVQRLVSQDPLDWFGLLRQQLGGARAGISLGLTDAGYVSPDGRRRLIVVKPRRPPFDTTFSRHLLDRLEAIERQMSAASASANQAAGEARPPMTTAYAGGHVISLETEALIKRESIWNSIGSLALILPLLLIVFRSIWLFAAGAVPSMASLLIVLRSEEHTSELQSPS